MNNFSRRIEILLKVSLCSAAALLVSPRLDAACGTSAWALRGHDAQRTYASDGCISGPLTPVFELGPNKGLPADANAENLLVDAMGDIFANMDILSVCPAPPPLGHVLAAHFSPNGTRIGWTCMNGGDQNLGLSPSLSPDGSLLWYNNDVGDLLNANMSDHARYIGWESWGDSVLDDKRIFSLDNHSNPDFYLSYNIGITYPHVYAIGYANGGTSWDATMDGMTTAQVYFSFVGSLAVDNSTVFFSRYQGSLPTLFDAIIAYDAATGQPKWTPPAAAAHPYYALTAGSNLLYGVDLGSDGKYHLMARRQSDGSVAWQQVLPVNPMQSFGWLRPYGHLVLAEGKIIVSLQTGSMVAYDALLGSQVWTSSVGATELAAATGSHTLVTLYNSAIHIVDLANGNELWQGAIPASFSNLVIQGNRIYFVSNFSSILGFVSSGASALSVTKIADKNGAVSGDIITYTISYKNTGISDLSNAIVTDSLPPGVSFLSQSSLPPATSFDPALMQWSFDLVKAGASGTITLRVTVK